MQDNNVYMIGSFMEVFVQFLFEVLTKKGGCSGKGAIAQQFLSSFNHEDADEVLEILQSKGANCDCEALLRVAHQVNVNNPLSLPPLFTSKDIYCDALKDKYPPVKSAVEKYAVAQQ